LQACEKNPCSLLLCQSLLKNLGCHFFTATAGGTATGRLPQLPHIAYAVIHRVADVRIGYSIANAHVHNIFPVITGIILNVNENDCQLGRGIAFTLSATLLRWLHGSKSDSAIGCHVNQCDPGGQVLTQKIRVDFIQCVICRVVQIKIPAGILVQIDNR